MRTTRAFSDDGVDHDPLLFPNNKLTKNRYARRKKSKVPPVLLEGSNPLVEPQMELALLTPPAVMADEVEIIGGESIETSIVNVRTVNMRRFLRYFQQEYLEDDDVLIINGVKHKVVTSDFTQFSNCIFPIVSCGSSGLREVIVLDPKRSPLLMKKYDAYRDMLIHYGTEDTNGLNAQAFIDLTNDFMRNHVFTARGNLRDRLNELLSRRVFEAVLTPKNPADAAASIPCVPIDVFISACLGVCRHHALVAAYLMDRFIRHHAKRCQFVGRVQLMRDNVGDVNNVAAHAWVTLVCRENGVDKTYSLDSQNNLTGNLADTIFTRFFGRAFGGHTTLNQAQKAEMVRHHLPSLG